MSLTELLYFTNSLNSLASRQYTMHLPNATIISLTLVFS